MIIRIKLTGRDYTKHKNEFKDIMKKHGLRWRGSFNDPWWGSGAEKVSAVYERDEVQNITISAILTWEGPTETDFIAEFKEWAKGLNADISEDRTMTKKVLDDILFFEMVYKPQQEYLETTGRPRSWIERDMRIWEEERGKRFGDDRARPV